MRVASTDVDGGAARVIPRIDRTDAVAAQITMRSTDTRPRAASAEGAASAAEGATSAACAQDTVLPPRASTRSRGHDHRPKPVCERNELRCDGRCEQGD